MYLTYQFSKIIQCGTDFSDVAGYTSRLGQLMEALDEMNAELENIAIDFPHEESMATDASIRFENVSFDTPAGDLVISSESIILLFLILQTTLSIQYHSHHVSFFISLQISRIDLRQELTP